MNRSTGSRTQGEPPLSGMRILTVEQYGAGPFATMLLADMGAEVIKIEDPESGDIGRYVPPFLGDRDSVYFQSLNRNKKSVALDISASKDRGLFEEMVSHSDVVFNNLRGDQPAKRRLVYDSLCVIRPKIVCAHLSGYGRSGQRAAEPGYDYLMQGYAGWMDITGEPGSPPQKSGLSLVDLSAGIAAGLGLVSAVLRARETGKGGDVDVALFDTAMSLLTYVGAWHLTCGYEPVRMADSSHPSQVPSQVLPTADGWLVVMCAKEKFYRRLVETMGRPDLATDERFVDFSARSANREVLVPILKELSRQKSTEDWLSLLRYKVPCAPVNTVEEALRDPAVVDREMIISVPHDTFGEVRQLASPIKVSGSHVSPVRAPRLGEHTEEVLRALTSGSEGELAELPRTDSAVSHQQVGYESPGEGEGVPE